MLNLKSHTEEELLALAAISAPLPSEDEIKHQMSMDRSRNPHNDNHKPPQRGRDEIISDYKINFAITFMKRLKARIDR